MLFTRLVSEALSPELPSPCDPVRMLSVHHCDVSDMCHLSPGDGATGWDESLTAHHPHCSNLKTMACRLWVDRMESEFFKFSPEDMFINVRERGRERERETSISSLLHAL